MMDYPHCDCYIIQQKLTNHRAFESVTGPKALQTVRVVTFVRKDSLPVLIWSLPKFIVGDNVVDNTCHGRINNFYSFADNQTGRVDKGFVFCPENGTIKDISLHKSSENTAKISNYRQLAEMVLVKVSTGSGANPGNSERITRSFYPAQYQCPTMISDGPFQTMTVLVA